MSISDSVNKTHFDSNLEPSTATDDKSDKGMATKIPFVDDSDIPIEPFHVTVGNPLPPNTTLAPHQAIVSALKAVQDPELLLDIYELGLIYDIRQHENGDVDILMTLTSPTCPVAGDMPLMAANAVTSVIGVGRVTVTLTFTPPWTPDRLSEDLKLIMGI